MMPVKHDPELNCRVCAIVFESLDFLLTEMRQLPELDRSRLHAHFLGSLCAWWVANGLAEFGDDPVPLFAMFGDILEQHGVDVLKINAIRQDMVARTYGGVH